MDLPVFLIVTADTCGACINFKKTIEDDLISALSKDRRFKFRTIRFKDMGINPNAEGKRFSEDLVNHIKFYPLLAIFSTDILYDKSNPSAPLKSKIYEGPRSVKDIMKWVDSVLKDETFIDRPKKSVVNVSTGIVTSRNPQITSNSGTTNDSSSNTVDNGLKLPVKTAPLSVVVDQVPSFRNGLQGKEDVLKQGGESGVLNTSYPIQISTSGPKVRYKKSEDFSRIKVRGDFRTQ